MGNEKPPEKIGIGPSGRLGGLIQFIIFTVVGIIAAPHAGLRAVVDHGGSDAGQLKQGDETLDFSLLVVGSVNVVFWIVAR